MTRNEFIICLTCGECINLRIQMGSYPVDFALNCPKCKTEISGKIEFEPFDINLNNAQVINEDTPNYKELTNFPIWCLEISAEFPTKKYISEKIYLMASHHSWLKWFVWIKRMI